MSIIQISNLTFKYNKTDSNVFENISLNIDTSWKLGLIGRNGKGKTTLLKLLANEYEYSGKILKNVDIEYFPYQISNDNKLTIDIIYDILPNIEEWKIEKELNLLNTKLEVLHRSFNTLSGGEKVKILLITLFLKENTFLVIDEPTNHLDKNTIEELIKYLNTKKGYIIVSHDRTFLDETIDHVMAINNEEIKIEKGNFSSWKQNKDRQDSFEINKNYKLKKDIERLEEAARNTKAWADDVESSKYNKRVSGLKPDKGYIGHQSAKMMQRATSIINRKQNLIDEKSKLLKNIDKEESLIMKPLIFEKKILVLVKDLQILYNTKKIFDKVTFDLQTKDRIAIIGKNGAGKSSILKLILGENINYTGTINISNNIKISYVSQNTDYLKGNLKNFVKKYKLDESIFKAMLSKLGFSKFDFDKDIENFSEGQKKKILLAKSISESAHLYIWDEPLNYIDVLSRIQIEDMILKYMPTIIFVEHDKMFVDNVASKVIYI